MRTKRNPTRPGNKEDKAHKAYYSLSVWTFRTLSDFGWSGQGIRHVQSEARSPSTRRLSCLITFPHLEHFFSNLRQESKMRTMGAPEQCS